MTKKRLVASGRYSPPYPMPTDYVESSYTFDNEGRMTGQTYPAAHDLNGTAEAAGVSWVNGESRALVPGRFVVLIGAATAAHTLRFYKDKRDYEKGLRNRSVWDNGCISSAAVLNKQDGPRHG